MFRAIDRALEEQRLVLSHPSVQYHHDAMDAFENWVAGRSLVPPGLLLEGGGTVDLLCDCFGPFMVA